MSKFERSITQTINKGGTQIKKRFNVHIDVDQKLSDLQSQVEKLISYEEHLKSRIKFQELKNDAKEKELRNDMNNFQNFYAEKLKSIHDEIENLVKQRNKLTEDAHSAKERLLHYDSEISEYQSYITNIESKEVKLGEKQTIYTNKYSDLPNFIALNNLTRKREERISKYTNEIDRIEMEIADLQSAMAYSEGKMKKIKDQEEKIKDKETEMTNYKNQLQKSCDNSLEEIKTQLRDVINSQYNVNEQYLLLHDEHVKLTESISQLSIQYMKLDVKQQNTENAVIIEGSNPETLTFDPNTQPKIDKLFEKLKSKIDDFDAEMEERTKTAKAKLEMLTQEKEKVLKEIKEYEEYTNNLNQTIKEKEKKAEEIEQKINDLEKVDEIEIIEEPKESKSNCVLCNMYFNQERGVRISSQIAAMRQVKSEESLRCEISRVNSASELLRTDIAKVTRENGILFAKVRSYQIQLEKMFLKQGERIDMLHGVEPRKPNNDLVDFVDELRQQRADKRSKIRDTFEKIEKKKDLLSRLNQLLVARKKESEKTLDSKLSRRFNDMDEFATKVQLELINWKTLRPNGEDQVLLDRWNALLP